MFTARSFGSRSILRPAEEVVCVECVCVCVCACVLICCSVREEYHVSNRTANCFFRVANRGIRERERETDLFRHDD